MQKGQIIKLPTSNVGQPVAIGDHVQVEYGGYSCFAEVVAVEDGEITLRVLTLLHGNR